MSDDIFDYENAIKVKYIEVTQPIGTFYIGSINAADIYRISIAEVRRNTGRAIEEYIGTQRDLNSTRVKELKQYISTIDACFPTSVILALDSIATRKDDNYIYIKRDDDIAKIIDGQHRIASLENYNSSTPFYLNVTIFIDMDIEDQAMVFSTINLSQTKVSKSLVYDLYDYAKSPSPQKTAHNIAKLLNRKEDSPFFGRIKILGKAEGKEEIITQAAFVEGLLRHMSYPKKQQMEDKDMMKRKKPIKDIPNLIFRKAMSSGKEAAIAVCIFNYFKAIQNRWPFAWKDIERQGNVLPRTAGFSSFMRLLKDIPLPYEGLLENIIPSIKDYETFITRIDLTDDDFSSETYKPGFSGYKDLYDDLLKSIYG